VLLRIGNLLQTRRLHLELQGQNQLLEQRVRDRTTQLQAAHNEILQRLALAAEYRDDETHQHTLRVGESSALLGAALGLPDEQVQHLRQAAPLHDIAKIGISDTGPHPRTALQHAWPVERAVAEITAQRERQFDPDVVDTFLGLLDQRKLPTVGPMTQPELSAQTTSPKP